MGILRRECSAGHAVEKMWTRGDEPDGDPQPSAEVSAREISDKCIPVKALTASTGCSGLDVHRRIPRKEGFPQKQSVAQRRQTPYFLNMRRWIVFLVAPVVATVALGVPAAADQNPVPLFTGEDLDRMFGPAPAAPSDPVDKTRPEDWRWVEQFLDRQYTRIDTDRQYDLDRRVVDVGTSEVERPWSNYGRPAWGLGYPASTWWNVVGGHYAASSYDGDRGSYRAYRDPYAWATGGGVRPGGRDNMPRGGHARQHGRRSK